MKENHVGAGKAEHASGQDPDDLRALEQIVEIVRQINGGADDLGLKEKIGEIESGCLFVLNADSMEWRFDKALALADILKKGNREAKGFAAGICKALQREFPFFEDLPEEPAHGNESLEAGIVKARDSLRPPPPDTVAATAPQPEQQASGTIAITCGEAVPAKLAELVTSEPFSGLFLVDQKTVVAIADDMRKNGFDAAHPVIVWAGRDIVIDGHTRLEAARRAGFTEIPVVFRDFASEDEALAYAIHEQHDRRNLTDSDIKRLVDALDKRRARGGDRRSEEARSKTSGEVSGPSSEATASLVGTSATKVEKARAVLKSGDAALQAKVDSGELSLNQAAAQARAAKRPVKQSAPVKIAVKVAAALNTHTAELRSCGNLYEWACDILAGVSARLQEAAKADNAGGEG